MCKFHTLHNNYGTAQVQRRTCSPVLCLNLNYLLRLSQAVLAQNLQESRLNLLDLSVGSSDSSGLIIRVPEIRIQY